MEYRGFKKGASAVVEDEYGNVVLSGVIDKLGTLHASIVCSSTGMDYDIPYEMIRGAGLVKTAEEAVIKEEEVEGITFVLRRQNDNKDGEMSVSYLMTADGETIWESEVIVTNVYDMENGWSSPDDFDENKLELIKQQAENGFVMLSESYANIIEIGNPAAGEDLAEGEEDPGKPAFAPGEGPDGGGAAGGGGMGGGGGGGETAAEMAANADAEGAGEEDAGGEDFGTEGEDIPADDAGGMDMPEPVTTSLHKTSFSRSVMAAQKDDKRLHNNPEHRINPLLRAEMDKQGIDSGDTNDLELADKMKNFDYGDSPKK